MSGFSRRRFLVVTAAACAASRLSAGTPLATWHGHALGAHSEIALAGVTRAEAAPVLAAVAAELDRLESLFSLYRADSALSRLNHDGILPEPSPDFLHLMSVARAVHDVTEGAFDPTVQPLFVLHAQAAMGTPVGPDQVHAALGRVGFDGVRVGTEAVRFLWPGMAMTLNGIAQGFATDRITSLLKDAGFLNVMVNVGEIRGKGVGPGNGWPVTLPGGQVVRLTEGAVATSRLTGTLVDPGAGIGHIFDPAGRRGTLRPEPVTALHESAAVADAVSTAAVVMEDRHLHQLDRLDAKIIRGDLNRI